MIEDADFAFAFADFSQAVQESGRAVADAWRAVRLQRRTLVQTRGASTRRRVRQRLRSDPAPLRLLPLRLLVISVPANADALPMRSRSFRRRASHLPAAAGAARPDGRDGDPRVPAVHEPTDATAVRAAPRAAKEPPCVAARQSPG